MVFNGPYPRKRGRFYIKKEIQIGLNKYPFLESPDGQRFALLPLSLIISEIIQFLNEFNKTSGIIHHFKTLKPILLVNENIPAVIELNNNDNLSFKTNQLNIEARFSILEIDLDQPPVKAPLKKIIIEESPSLNSSASIFQKKAHGFRNNCFSVNYFYYSVFKIENSFDPLALLFETGMQQLWFQAAHQFKESCILRGFNSVKFNGQFLLDQSFEIMTEITDWLPDTLVGNILIIQNNEMKFKITGFNLLKIKF